MQMEDPIIRRFHFSWSRNQKPTPQERRSGNERHFDIALSMGHDFRREWIGVYRTIQDPSCGRRKQLVLPQTLKEKILLNVLNTALEIAVIGRA